MQSTSLNFHTRQFSRSLAETNRQENTHRELIGLDLKISYCSELVEDFLRRSMPNVSLGLLIKLSLSGLFIFPSAIPLGQIFLLSPAVLKIEHQSGSMGVEIFFLIPQG